MRARPLLHVAALRVSDIHFDLQSIVIGPQGVCEEARVTGTHKAKWLTGHRPVSKWSFAW